MATLWSRVRPQTSWLAHVMRTRLNSSPLDRRGRALIRSTLSGLPGVMNLSERASLGPPRTRRGLDRSLHLRGLLMKIAILGAGSVSVPLARVFAAAGHDVKLANSREPATIRDLAASLGATAALAADAVHDVDVIITSVNPGSYAAIRPLLEAVPHHVPVLDTGNYHPLRDGQISALDDGQIEAVWISEQLGRPVTKAWNTLLAQTLVEKSAPAGTPGRIAITVAGDNPRTRQIAATLTDISGIDP